MMGRLVAHGARPEAARAIASAAEGCARVLRAREHLLTETDRAELILAYYRAESLAHHALCDVVAQVPARFRPDLERQLTEEASHIEIFGAWGGERPEVPRPKTRERPWHVWFKLLLDNEVTGYCQFRMLAEVAPTAARRAQVLAVMSDEEEHIGRLCRWLEPVWPTPEGDRLAAIGARFVRELPGRMHQFFPRRDLDGVREPIAGLIADAVTATQPRQISL
jgi:hypothetical protein